MSSSNRKIVQVPVDDRFLERIDGGASLVRESRAQFVRQACELRLRQLEEEAKEKQYEAGYIRQPEDDDQWTDAAAEVLWADLPKEKW